MSFNHYAKIKRILDNEPPGWYIRRINQPTTAQNFRGEKVTYDYYYRVFSVSNKPIKYCKFQQLDRLASILGTDTETLPVL